MVEAWCVFDCSILLKFAVYVVLSILGESTSDGVPFSPDRKMFRVWRWIESIDYRQFVCPFLRGGVGRWAQIFVAKVGFPLGISPCMCSFSVPATKWLFCSLVCPSSRFSFEALFGSFVCNSRQACSFSSERLRRAVSFSLPDPSGGRRRVSREIVREFCYICIARLWPEFSLM